VWHITAFGSLLWYIYNPPVCADAIWMLLYLKIWRQPLHDLLPHVRILS
jgi:hypothetical protein